MGNTPSVVWHSGQQRPPDGPPPGGMIMVVSNTHFQPGVQSPLLVQCVPNEEANVSQLALMAQNPSPSTVKRQKQQARLLCTRPPQANCGSCKAGDTGTHRHSPWAVGATVKLP